MARFWNATVVHQYTLSCAYHRARFITCAESEAYWAHKHIPLHLASRADHHMDIGYERRHSDGSCVSAGIDMQNDIFDVISHWRAIWVWTLQYIRIFLILVTKLWDMIIFVWMCKGRMHHAKVREPKSCCNPANPLHYCLLITVKGESKSKIRDEIY